MKIVHATENQPKQVAHANLEVGKLYRSANVSLENATIFLCVCAGLDGGRVVDLTSNMLRGANCINRYVEVDGTLTITGDVVA